MFLKQILHDPILLYAWRRVLSLWKPMAIWTLLVWLAVAIIMVPFFSSILGWGFFRGDQLVIGNEELISWLFTPQGFIYGVLAGALAMMGGIIRYAGLFQIVTDDIKGTPVSVRGTALGIAPLIPNLFRLCMMAILVTILLVLPLAAGVWGIYHHFLWEQDINYYLSVRPSEWYNAIVAASAWTLIWFVGTAWLLCRSLLILPAFLSGERSIREAIKESWNLPQKQAHRLLGLMGLSIGIWVLVNIVADATFLFSAGLIIEWVASIFSSLRTIVLVTGFYAVVTLILGAVIGFLGFSFAATVLTKYYYESIGVGIGIPSTEKLKRLPAQMLVLARYWLHTSRMIPLIALLVIGSFAISNFMLERIPEPQTVEIFAHRGGPSTSPENTLAALEEAIAAGAEYSEIDVQRTKDGVVVLIHDADLMRVTGDPRSISEMDYADLKGLTQVPDDGSPPGERRIVTLDDYLSRALGRVNLMIELKYYHSDPMLAAEVVRLVQKHKMEDDVLFMSMKLDALRQLKDAAPDIPIGYVSALALGELTNLPVDFLAIAHQRITPQIIRSAKQQSMPVYAWSVNRADAMADVMELGVNGIITDDPELAVRVRDEFKTLTPAERLLLRFRKIFADESD